MKKILYTLLAACAALVVNYLLSNSALEANVETPTPSAPAAVTETGAPQILDVPRTIAEVEKLSGFNVVEPAYLPPGVSFDFATYQEPPYPNVTQHFKLADKTQGNMGEFFQIVQQPLTETFPNPTACGVTDANCETIPLGDLFIKYRLTSPTEALTWDMNGFNFQLLRNAGEPGRIYKDDLLKVAASMMPSAAKPDMILQAPEIALATLKASFAYVGPLTIVQEGEMSYGEFGGFMHQTIDHPADLRVWAAVYFSKSWQYLPAISASSSATAIPSFAGCVHVVINLADGSPMEAAGPLSNGILPACDL